MGYGMGGNMKLYRELDVTKILRSFCLCAGHAWMLCGSLVSNKLTKALGYSFARILQSRWLYGHIFLGIILSMSMSAYASANAATLKPKISFANSNTPIIVQQGKNSMLTIYLQSNATTGYSWFLSSNYPKRWLQPISRRFIAPRGKLMGAPGTEVWRFRVLPAAFVVPRIANIVFSYARSWEASDMRQMKLTLYVMPKQS